MSWNHVWKVFWKEIKRTFTFWHKINKPPKWVLRAHKKWKMKLPTHPYDMKKVFVGKNHLYKVVHGTGAQGEAPILGWYKKKRFR